MSREFLHDLRCIRLARFETGAIELEEENAYDQACSFVAIDKGVVLNEYPRRRVITIVITKAEFNGRRSAPPNCGMARITRTRCDAPYSMQSHRLND